MKSVCDDATRDGTSPPDLPAMRASLLGDFANGVIGRRHNTFQHRSRILRQLSAARSVSPT